MHVYVYRQKKRSQRRENGMEEKWLVDRKWPSWTGGNKVSLKSEEMENRRWKEHTLYSDRKKGKRFFF